MKSKEGMRSLRTIENEVRVQAAAGVEELDLSGDWRSRQNAPSRPWR